jgi:hypothetical protein
LILDCRRSSSRTEQGSDRDVSMTVMIMMAVAVIVMRVMTMKMMIKRIFDQRLEATGNSCDSFCSGTCEKERVFSID